jgi:hypothetical protein
MGFTIKYVPDSTFYLCVVLLLLFFCSFPFLLQIFLCSHILSMKLGSFG